MLDEKAVSEVVLSFEGWNTQKLVIALKNLDGKMFIDARKWLVDESKGLKTPTKKGLSLEVRDWKLAIEEINKVLSANT